MNDFALMINYDLHNRTLGEELWLWRRKQFSPSGRQRSKIGSGMSQAEAAISLSTTTQKYRDAEADRIPEREIRLFLALACAEMNSEPSRGELCALARRRVSYTLADTAQNLNVSRVTLLEHERAGAANVMQLWLRLGFTF